MASRFTRGDDSILNRDSSAERRFLEGVLLVKSAGALVRLVAGARTTRLIGGKAEIQIDSVSARAFSLLPIDYPPVPGIGGKVVSENIGSVLEGLQGARDVVLGAKLSPGSAKTFSVEANVNLDDVLVAFLGAGYLIEKSAGLVGPIAEGITTGLGKSLPG